jgi:hypothetical protein
VGDTCQENFSACFGSFFFFFVCMALEKYHNGLVKILSMLATKKAVIKNFLTANKKHARFHLNKVLQHNNLSHINSI